MSEDTVAVIVTIAFFVVMAAWIPLVECCGRTMRREPKREPRKERNRMVELKREPSSKKGSGYETAVMLTILAAVGSLGLLN
ncbi:hypothetical protein [Granulicella sp. S190]|uniref:hypothetical protein n=1 Tax=Granulicella sp. S190 TaxID=1747226 RepID=UPI00131B1011|nr:hypothetical protein [Granulicella sp. S190]